MKFKVIGRFLNRVEVRDGCWDWLGSVGSGGYGSLSVTKYKSTSAHRFAFEFFVGPIPKGLVVDHLCRNRRCVNPTHLEAVTSQENVLRGRTIVARYAERTCCANGHLYSVENTFYTPRSGRSRWCRQCSRDKAHQRYQAAKAKVTV